MTAAVDAVARQVGVGKESLRRWVAQADVDRGEVAGVTTGELEEIRKLKSENRRLREDVAILRAATTFFAGSSTPETVDDGVHRYHEKRFAVESVCRVLREQGCQVAAVSMAMRKSPLVGRVRSPLVAT